MVCHRAPGSYRLLAVYEFDQTRRPLVVLRMRAPVSADELEQMKADVDALIERAEPFALLWDLDGVEVPARPVVMDLLAWTRSARTRFLQVFDDANPRIPSFTAYYLPGMIGNLLRFFMQMVPSIRAQQVVCSSFDEGLAACERALESMEFERQVSRHAG